MVSYVDVESKDMMKFAASLSVIFAAVGAVSPVAAQTFTPPAGCDAMLTVQQNACLVTHVWTCEADNPGDKWLALMTASGPARVFKVDNDFQWLETFTPMGSEALVLPSADPASMTELLANGIDTYDFVIQKDVGTERVVGVDRLPGTTTVIDGEELLDTTYSSDTINQDGEIIEASEGVQYISEKHRLFFFGRSWDKSTPDEVNDASPVTFIYPGEEGFLSMRPQYGCGVIESGYRP